MLIFFYILSFDSVFHCCTSLFYRKQKEKLQKRDLTLKRFLRSLKVDKRFGTPFYPTTFNLFFSFHAKNKFNCFITSISLISTLDRVS